MNIPRLQKELYFYENYLEKKEAEIMYIDYKIFIAKIIECVESEELKIQCNNIFKKHFLNPKSKP